MKYSETPSLVIILFVLLLSPVLKGQEVRLSFMFYNVENLFDTIDCDLDDDEFLPMGLRRWDSYRYYSKLSNISKVIIACNGWSPPPVIGLCEVENKMVIDDLVKYTYLSRHPYKALYADSFDKRGIGVAMLIDTSQFTIDNIVLSYPVYDSGHFITTRSLLIVRLKNDIDSLSVLVCHWPSRRGGVAATEKLRKKVAQLVAEEISNIHMRYGESEKIVVMGDLNSEPDSEVVKNDLGAADPSNAEIIDNWLYNLSLPSYGNGVGSYKYQGLWSLFDQVIVSGSLINSDCGYSVDIDAFRIYQSVALLIPDTRYNGVKPFSTYKGPIYSGGFSDHLPVILDFKTKGLYQPE